MDKVTVTPTLSWAASHTIDVANTEQSLVTMTKSGPTDEGGTTSSLTTEGHGNARKSVAVFGSYGTLAAVGYGLQRCRP